MLAIYITASVAFFCGFCLAALFHAGHGVELPPNEPAWKVPCDGAKRCPNANDVTCEECRK